MRWATPTTIPRPSAAGLITPRQHPRDHSLRSRGPHLPSHAHNAREAVRSGSCRGRRRPHLRPRPRGWRRASGRRRRAGSRPGTGRHPAHRPAPRRELPASPRRPRPAARPGPHRRRQPHPHPSASPAAPAGEPCRRRSGGSCAPRLTSSLHLQCHDQRPCIGRHRNGPSIARHENGPRIGHERRQPPRRDQRLPVVGARPQLRPVDPGRARRQIGRRKGLALAHERRPQRHRPPGQALGPEVGGARQGRLPEARAGRPEAERRHQVTLAERHRTETGRASPKRSRQQPSADRDRRLPEARAGRGQADRRKLMLLADDREAETGRTARKGRDRGGVPLAHLGRPESRSPRPEILGRQAGAAAQDGLPQSRRTGLEARAHQPMHLGQSHRPQPGRLRREPLGRQGRGVRLLGRRCRREDRDVTHALIRDLLICHVRGLRRPILDNPRADYQRRAARIDARPHVVDDPEAARERHPVGNARHAVHGDHGEGQMRGGREAARRAYRETLGLDVVRGNRRRRGLRRVPWPLELQHRELPQQGRAHPHRDRTGLGAVRDPPEHREVGARQRPRREQRRPP
uniref:Uncharacterized protein n=1 Tax=Cereibacter sphaeroides (strain ATCC 17025 / ATH 2.4.3) TaxID=349102 RepID=A4WS08_CERS5